jgi:broad specificity phosphatase PhoE
MKEQLVALVMRHGETELNASGAFRSWVDIPLNETGVQQAKDAAKFLKKYDVKNIISSPLLRAFVTADICSGGLQVFQHRGLFPWRLGIFSGLPRDEHQDALRLFVKSPQVTIPGGESLQDFEDRQFAFWETALRKSRNEGLTLYVAHTSNVVSLENFANEEDSGEPESSESVKPGGVAAIWWDGGYHRVDPIFGTPEVAKFGSS